MKCTASWDQEEIGLIVYRTRLATIYSASAHAARNAPAPDGLNIFVSSPSIMLSTFNLVSYTIAFADTEHASPGLPFLFTPVDLDSETDHHFRQVPPSILRLILKAGFEQSKVYFSICRRRCRRRSGPNLEIDYGQTSIKDLVQVLVRMRNDWNNAWRIARKSSLLLEAIISVKAIKSFLREIFLYRVLRRGILRMQKFCLPRKSLRFDLMRFAMGPRTPILAESFSTVTGSIRLGGIVYWTICFIANLLLASSFYLFHARLCFAVTTLCVNHYKSILCFLPRCCSGVAIPLSSQYSRDAILLLLTYTSRLFPPAHCCPPTGYLCTGKLYFHQSCQMGSNVIYSEASRLTIARSAIPFKRQRKTYMAKTFYHSMGQRRKEEADFVPMIIGD